VEVIRRPSRWLPVFLIAVAIGQTLMSTLIKDLVDRVRPTINPPISSNGNHAHGITVILRVHW